MTPLPSDSYSLFQRFCHWAIAVLFVVQMPLGFATTFAMDIGGRTLPIVAVVHATIGIVIMVLGILLCLARWYRGELPSISMPLWQRKLAKIVQAILLFSLIAIPMTGGAILVGITTMEERHGILAIIGIFLAAIHASAALFHHFVMRDATLRRMLSGR